MERHEQREARVIPIILRPCDWHRTPFGKLQGLPTDGKPVTIWADRDQALLNVVLGIGQVVEELLAESLESPSQRGTTPTGTGTMPTPQLSGIEKTARGRRGPKSANSDGAPQIMSEILIRLQQLQQLEEAGEVDIPLDLEYQRKILDKFLVPRISRP